MITLNYISGGKNNSKGGGHRETVPYFTFIFSLFCDSLIFIPLSHKCMYADHKPCTVSIELLD